MKVWMIVATSKMNGRRTVCTGKVWDSFWSQDFPTQVFEGEHIAEQERDRLAQENDDKATYEVYEVEFSND
jgi:GH24 family phage-related lysozyme (muramidase)